MAYLAHEKCLLRQFIHTAHISLGDRRGEREPPATRQTHFSLLLLPLPAADMAADMAMSLVLLAGLKWDSRVDGRHSARRLFNLWLYIAEAEVILVRARSSDEEWEFMGVEAASLEEAGVEGTRAETDIRDGWGIPCDV